MPHSSSRGRVRARPGQGRTRQIHVPDALTVAVAECLSRRVDKSADEIAAELFGPTYTRQQRSQVYDRIYRLRQQHNLPIRRGGYTWECDDKQAAEIRDWIKRHSMSNRNVSRRRLATA